MLLCDIFVVLFNERPYIHEKFGALLHNYDRYVKNKLSNKNKKHFIFGLN